MLSTPYQDALMGRFRVVKIGGCSPTCDRRTNILTQKLVYIGWDKKESLWFLRLSYPLGRGWKSRERDRNISLEHVETLNHQDHLEIYQSTFHTTISSRNTPVNLSSMAILALFTAFNKFLYTGYRLEYGIADESNAIRAIMLTEGCYLPRVTYSKPRN